MSKRFQRKSEGEPEKSEGDELSDSELAGHTAAALPDRAALSSLDADIAIPIDPALAADVLSGLADELADEEDDGLGVRRDAALQQRLKAAGGYAQAVPAPGWPRSRGRAGGT